jgi:hypothetical protein
MSRMVEDERQHDDGIEARRRTIIRENWYRDVWLFAITAFVVWVLIAGIGANEDRIGDIQQSRFLFQFQACVNTNGRNLEAKEKAKRLNLSPQGQETVVTLVDALVPFTADCEAKARDGIRIPPAD